MQPNFVLLTPTDATGIVMEDITDLTVGDLCRACSAQADVIVELVSEGVIEITSVQQVQPQSQWRFTGVHLHRAKIAMRLHHDLGVNFAGAALALQLMDELCDARFKLRNHAI
jgi:chaperone modulatory protein CbpM